MTKQCDYCYKEIEVSRKDFFTPGGKKTFMYYQNTVKVGKDTIKCNKCQNKAHKEYLFLDYVKPKNDKLRRCSKCDKPTVNRYKCELCWARSNVLENQSALVDGVWGKIIRE